MHVDPAELRAEIAAHQLRVRKATYQRTWRSKTAKGTQGQHPQRGTRVSETLGTMLLSLARHLSQRPNFRNYTFVDDMIQVAVVDMMHACEVFDLSRQTNGRPASCFSYLTQTAWRSFTRVIEREGARGLRGAVGKPFEVCALPSLTLGQFDAESLSAALRERDGGFPRPEASGATCIV